MSMASKFKKIKKKINKANPVALFTKTNILLKKQISKELKK